LSPLARPPRTSPRSDSRGFWKRTIILSLTSVMTRNEPNHVPFSWAFRLEPWTSQIRSRSSSHSTAMFVVLSHWIFIYDLSTNSMEQAPCWETNSCSASKILRCLWNPNIRYRVHTKPPLELIMSQFNPVPNFINSSNLQKIFLTYILILSYHIWLGFPKCSPFILVSRRP
jgi:hypothetical protein